MMLKPFQGNLHAAIDLRGFVGGFRAVRRGRRRRVELRRGGRRAAAAAAAAQRRRSGMLPVPCRGARGTRASVGQVG